MSNSLLITKQTGNFFSIQLNSESPIVSDQNRLTTIGNECHFKTANGANIIKEQNILYSDVTLVASGAFTFASVNLLWTKLIEVGFFAGLGGGSGGSGVDRFDELDDTFTYVGRDGQVVVVNESQQKLETIAFANVSKFTDLTDAPSALQANKMVTTNANGTALILADLPPTPETFLNSVGFFDYADLATQTTPISFVTGVASKLTNDGLGISTNKNFPPYGVTDVWNSVDNQMILSQLSTGDTVRIRFDVTATTTSANQVIRGFINIGVGTPSQYTLNVFGQQIKTAQANQFTILTELYVGSDTIKNAPCEFFLLSDGNGSVKVNGFAFFILRRNVNIVTVEAIVADTYKADVIYSGSAISVPSGIKIRNVYLNQVPCYASEWLQTGTNITITTAFTGDKVTLIN
jgi:hypothetical protein